jgi:hypothetical protein
MLKKILFSAYCPLFCPPFFQGEQLAVRRRKNFDFPEVPIFSSFNMKQKIALLVEKKKKTNRVEAIFFFYFQRRVLVQILL